jgi:hypothetical protein
MNPFQKLCKQKGWLNKNGGGKKFTAPYQLRLRLRFIDWQLCASGVWPFGLPQSPSFFFHSPA